MSNMSYCRFQNTLADLRECYTAMEDEREEDWSEDERTAFRKLVTICRRIGEDFSE